ncbi:uncharacterized protein TM35_000013230 [Trypanosoma theileri]|uniref:Uncharacterized protein n=1 Tax=Trypanosoma theileri TaxID=67003 RepID=A0A1X0P950_9TRYP|nr:uncharacterized protein TM35_000013230 [Trypanosoma theileri]ORC93446.1 hypothetical protein TM35_000013230 [Trypanosoma theileri]
MELYLDDQRETPSFSVNLFAERINSILEAPLPKCLRLKGEGDTKPSITSITGSHAAQIVSPRRSARSGGVGIQHKKPIHEVLLDKGRLAAEQKEALRLKVLEEELSELRPAPSITYETLKKTPRKGTPIENRLLMRAQEAEKRRQHEAKCREEQMLKEMSVIAPFRPNISRRGRKATPKARKMAEEAQNDWYRRREEKREAIRTAKVLEDLSEVRDGPIINPRSERLAARRREREGLSGLSGIEALIERDRIAQVKRWERHEMEKRKEQTPQITLYAATLQREGDAAERLYADSYEKEVRRLQRERQLKYDNNRPLFTPRISPHAATKPRFCNVEDELMQKHMQSMVLKEEMRRREEAEELRRHQPAIDPVSEAIAARLPDTSLERLYRHPRRVQRYMDSTEREVEAETKTTISGVKVGAAAAAAESSFNGSNRGTTSRVTSLPESMAEALQSYEERRLEKMRRLQEEQERRQREECTFAPVTNGRGANIGGPEDVATRNQQWLARREGKLREMRQRKEIEKVRDCTFKPERETTYPLSARGESVYGGDGTPWGVQEYLERQQEARRLRQEREMRLQRRPSSAPRPSVTTPQEFVLGRREGTPVRSLQRPPHVRLMSPDRDELDLQPQRRQEQEQEQEQKQEQQIRKNDDLSVYERIYNRIYNSALNGISDETGSSLCIPPSLYS